MPRNFRWEWDDVIQHDLVTVSMDGKFVQEGVVDDRSVDGAFVWLFDSLGQRKLLHEHDGYDLVKLHR